MKPPVVHQPVQPPDSDNADHRDESKDAAEPSGTVAADDGRDVRYQSTKGPAPGLVGDFGPIVETAVSERDGAAEDEREAQ